MQTDTQDRKGPSLALISVGILAVFGLSIGGVLVSFSNVDEEDDAPGIALAPGETIPLSSDALEQSLPSDERPMPVVPDEPGGDSSGAASTSGQPDILKVEEDPQPERTAPRPEAESSDPPTLQGKPRPGPLKPPASRTTKESPTRKSTSKKTDRSVQNRLLKAIKRQCSKGHEGTPVSVELTVGSKGDILHKIVSAPGSLKPCVGDELRGVTFPEGSVRQVTLSTKL